MELFKWSKTKRDTERKRDTHIFIHIKTQLKVHRIHHIALRRLNQQNKNEDDDSRSIGQSVSYSPSKYNARD